MLLKIKKKCVTLQEKKLADLVLWKPAFFGAKPEMIIKGGNIAWANMGDANASIPTPEPVIITDYYCFKVAPHLSGGFKKIQHSLLFTLWR